METILKETIKTKPKIFTFLPFPGESLAATPATGPDCLLYAAVPRKKTMWMGLKTVLKALLKMTYIIFVFFP